jgi:hypothetical protein
MSEEEKYELLYLRAIMEWLENGGGKYEPLDFEEIYQDWKERVQKGQSSHIETSWHNDFVAPERPS